MPASGIFGVMAYSVRLRSREMAVRLTLGAACGDIFRLVAGQGALWTAAGLAIGIAGRWPARAYCSGSNPTIR
jgi:ABC-type antimicrobial peptide transport system permease subunit